MGHLAGWAAEIKTIAEAPGVAFSGALVKLTANESIADDSATDVPWDSEVYDVGGWWAVSPNPTRLTVPTGVSRIVVSANVIWTVNQTGARFLGIQKNGATFIGMGQLRHLAKDNSEGNVISAAVDVSAGDYFELSVLQTSGGNLNLLTANETWFAIRAV